MKRHGLFYTFVLPILIAGLSSAALASDRGATASSFGTRPGVSPRGGGNCWFAYRIRKFVDDDDRARDGNRDEVRFKVIVDNIGNCELGEISVKDFVPERTRVVSVFPEPDFRRDDDLVWRDFFLEPGERVVFDIKVRRDDDRARDGRRITNVACAFTPWIGQRICDDASARVGDDH